MGRVIDALELGIPCFLNVDYFPQIGDWPNVYYIGLACSRHVPLQGDWLQNGTWFLSYATTMVPATQIAQYIGFSKYTFTGVDGYVTCPKDNDLNHFDKSYNADILPDDKDTEDAAQIDFINARQAKAMKFIYSNIVPGGLYVQ